MLSHNLQFRESTTYYKEILNNRIAFWMWKWNHFTLRHYVWYFISNRILALMLTTCINLLELEIVKVMVLHETVVPLSSAGSIVTVALMNVVLVDITSYFTGCGPI